MRMILKIYLLTFLSGIFILPVNSLASEQPQMIPTIIFGQRLALQGIAEKIDIQADNKPEGNFKPSSFQFKLLRVVPLRNRINDPFNERTLASVIKNAQRPRGSTSNTFNPSILSSEGPVSQINCALNINLSVLTGLPDARPLGNTININTSAPFNLQLGLGAFNSALNIAIISQLNQTQANITLGAGFTLISGSLGIKSEGSTLSYAVRRNSDSAEFNLNFRFLVERVFDDNGISIQSISGQLCQQGGPV